MSAAAVAPLVVDTDGGIDDILALLLLVAAGRPPDLVTVCFGNVDLGTAGYNVRAALELAGATPEVHLGAARPLVGETIHARHIHGDDGLGGSPIAPPTRPAASADAIAALQATLRDAARWGAPVDLLTLGPLTNVALALRLEPGIAAGVGRLVVMGGTCFGRGNTTPAAEYNVYADPEAASIVLTAGLPTTMVPWEVCADGAVPGSVVDGALAAAPPNEITALVGGSARHARGVRRRLAGLDEFVLSDPLAAAVLLDPSIVERSVVASVGVELAGGLTRGMTVVDPSARLGTPGVEVVEAVDRRASHGLVARMLTAKEARRGAADDVGTAATRTRVNPDG